MNRTSTEIGGIQVDGPSGKTLYDKLWDAHLVATRNDGQSLIYIDRHLLHEVTSPQAFEGLGLARRGLWRTETNIATADHNVPTTRRELGVEGIEEEIAKLQVLTLQENCERFDVELIDVTDRRQGIVHVIGPEQGLTLPGMTIVCGDSHTSTHGAFAALAQGIGTSEVEHVMATQTLAQSKAKNLRVCLDGRLSKGLSTKDVVLRVIDVLSASGGRGYTIEFAGDAIADFSMEARMTLCNMAIEAGARAGLVAVDDTTLEYLRDRPFAPSGDRWAEACEYWRSLKSDADAQFDEEVRVSIDSLEPRVTWGTSPDQSAGIGERVPAATADNHRALEYMGLKGGEAMQSIEIDRIFIGSCTNARIEDLREAAQVLANRKISARVRQAMVVPGSGLVKTQAEAEGLDEVFLSAGFEWRAAGCSMCLGMNPDQLAPGERCASTSNRNFEGRQGQGGRTHLLSPAMAAASAVAGHLTDVRDYL